jgi:hypothetical protein
MIDRHIIYELQGSPGPEMTRAWWTVSELWSSYHPEAFWAIWMSLWVESKRDVEVVFEWTVVTEHELGTLAECLDLEICPSLGSDVYDAREFGFNLEDD